MKKILKRNLIICITWACFFFPYFIAMGKDSPLPKVENKRFKKHNKLSPSSKKPISKKSRKLRNKHWIKKSRWIQNILRFGKSIAPLMEVKRNPKRPSWVPRKGEKPLFVFVQITDLHLWRERTFLLDKAIDYIHNQINPAFFVFTGDNVSGPDRKKGQRFLKHHLDQKLVKERKTPYFIIRGDNDAKYFEENFGSSNWAFVYGGIQFVGIGLDYDIDWVGIGFFEQQEWLKKVLRRPYPTILFLHQPVYPPTFWNASEVERIMVNSQNVFMGLYGHIHYDFAFRKKGILHIHCLSLRQNSRHGFKAYFVYPDRVVVQTHELNKDGRFHFSNIWQVAYLPKPLHSRVEKRVHHRLTLPNSQIHHVRDFQEMFEKVLEKRFKRLWKNLQK